MKKTILVSIMPLLALFIFVAAYSPSPIVPPVSDDLDLGWPDEVMTLLKQSCFDCHSSDGGNIKAKAELNFSKWDNYKLTKKINKLTAISEEVKAKNMPPQKYLNKNPHAILSDEEISVIVQWANTEADKLMEE